MTSLYDLPGHLIRRLHQISVSAFASEAAAAGFDLTPVQFAALSMLEQNPGIDQATLAGLIAYDRVTIGGVISRLEARGLLQRETSEQDRRARCLHVTKQGAALLQTVWPAVRRTQDAIVRNLTEEEYRIFLHLMQKITDENNNLSRAPLRVPAEREPGKT